MTDKKKQQHYYRDYIHFISVCALCVGIELIRAEYYGAKDQFEFQRIGSVIVILAILTEVLIMRLVKKIERAILVEVIHSGDFKMMNQLEEEHLKPSIIYSECAVLFLGLSGTLIWGYGDIIYLFVKSF